MAMRRACTCKKPKRHIRLKADADVHNLALTEIASTAHSNIDLTNIAPNFLPILEYAIGEERTSIPRFPGVTRTRPDHVPDSSYLKSHQMPQH